MDTNKLLKGTLAIIGFAILVYISSLIPERCKRINEMDNAYEYKTDSISKDEYLKLKTDYEKLKKLNIALINTPPKKVIRYLTKPHKIDSVKSDRVDTKVFMDSVKEPIIYSNDFLTQHTKASKLIEFKLTKDSLKISTLNIKGITEVKDYPLYLENFGYLWYDNELNHYKLTAQPKDKKDTSEGKWNQLYLNGGYEFMVEKPQIGIEYNLKLGRFKIDASSNMLIQKTPQFQINANLGYRLLK